MSKLFFTVFLLDYLSFMPLWLNDKHQQMKIFSSFGYNFLESFYVMFAWCWFTGINFGDPHITTLDGMDYTFNGFGEYTMLSINTSTASFTLQARTELASSANGTTINATVFTAFVAEDHTGSKVQIEMARNKEGLDFISFNFMIQELKMLEQHII